MGILNAIVKLNDFLWRPRLKKVFRAEGKTPFPSKSIVGNMLTPLDYKIRSRPKRKQIERRWTGSNWNN